MSSARMALFCSWIVIDPGGYLVRSAVGDRRSGDRSNGAALPGVAIELASTTLWNAEAGYRLSNGTRIVAEVFNLFDSTCRTSTTSTPRACRVSR